MRYLSSINSTRKALSNNVNLEGIWKFIHERRDMKVHTCKKHYEYFLWKRPFLEVTCYSILVKRSHVIANLAKGPPKGVMWWSTWLFIEERIDMSVQIAKRHFPRGRILWSTWLCTREKQHECTCQMTFSWRSRLILVQHLNNHTE